MKTNEKLRKEILQVAENQLRDNKPPETRQTYNRLLQSGITDENARIYIGQCITVEIFHVMKYHEPFNQTRFIKNLNNLPAKPFGDERLDS